MNYELSIAFGDDFAQIMIMGGSQIDPKAAHWLN